MNYRHRQDWNPISVGLDASTWQPLPPKDGHIPQRYRLRGLLNRIFLGKKSSLTVYDYADTIEQLTRKSPPNFPDYPTVLPNWDNTPRSGENGLVLHGSTPELFGRVLRRGLSLISDNEPEHQIVFIKAWNEWAEGNYLEPDQFHGHGYLNVVRQELSRFRTEYNI